MIKINKGTLKGGKNDVVSTIGTPTPKVICWKKAFEDKIGVVEPSN